MEIRKVPLTDRLRDRGFIDQWAFIIFATIGFAAILSAKWLGMAAGGIAVGAVLLMLMYALVVGWTGTGRVRADQAGDNCYYLGLVYTLASLSYAIATFDPNDTATTIVQGFGVALATTIFGLILRVFFNQGRPDLENVEEQARLELTQASSQLKSELQTVVRQMKDFSLGLQQSMQEAHDASAERIEHFTSTSVEGLSSVVEAANETIREEANDFAARAKKYDQTFTKLLDKIEAHSSNLEDINEAHAQLRNSAELSQTALDTAAESLGSMAATASNASGAVESVRQISELTSDTAERMRQSVAALEESLRTVISQTEEQLDALRSGPSETVAVALDTLKRASNDLETELQRITKAHSDLTLGLSDQTKAALDTARSHNEALDEELRKSRESSDRVHQSFVEMTEKLARSVEGHV